jgi:hypothetical protein
LELPAVLGALLGERALVDGLLRGAAGRLGTVLTRATAGDEQKQRKKAR